MPSLPSIPKLIQTLNDRNSITIATEGAEIEARAEDEARARAHGGTVLDEARAAAVGIRLSGGRGVVVEGWWRRCVWVGGDALPWAHDGTLPD